MGNEYGARRKYQIDFDRPVHIRDHLGVTYHRYLDEGYWRDARGQPVPELPPNFDN